MNPGISPPEIAPLDGKRMLARQAHLEREVGRSARRAPRRRIVRGGILLAAALAGGAVLLTGRGDGPDALAKARAAVSRGPYLGVLVRSAHPANSTLIHLGTHSTEEVHAEAEIWFDTRKHGAGATIGGCTRLVGASTRSGCIGSLVGLSSPTVVTGSIDSYRKALASGEVQRAGSGTVRGHRVWWLRIKPSSPFPARPGWASFVAVDQKTGNPLRIEGRKGSQTVVRENIDVLPETRRPPSYLLTPTQLGVPPPPPVPGARRGSVAVTPAQAAHAIRGAVWPGRTAAGQLFRRARVITLDDGHKQLELLYGGPCPGRCVLVKQGIESGWALESRLYPALPNNSILVNGGRYADGRVGALRIRIEGTSKAAVLAAARALQPIRP